MGEYDWLGLFEKSQKILTSISPTSSRRISKSRRVRVEDEDCSSPRTSRQASSS